MKFCAAPFSPDSVTFSTCGSSEKIFLKGGLVIAYNQPIKITGKETYKKQITEQMKKLGTYKEEYALTVDLLAELLEQYSYFMSKFKNSGYSVETKCGSGGMKKSQIFSTLESLRKDIIQLIDRLALNPKIMEGIEVQDPKKKSKLENALSGAVIPFVG